MSVAHHSGLRVMLLAAAAAALWLLGGAAAECRAIVCFFAPFGERVRQPTQKVFITWDPERQVESFTVQPRFSGDARHFAMVVPTPSRPKIDEMPREFFKALETFTVLEPTDTAKYKAAPRWRRRARRMDGGGGGLFDNGDQELDTSGRRNVRLLEAGVVGSLDYKVIQSTSGRADELFRWISENGYDFKHGEDEMSGYARNGWFFTVMKIDPAQRKRGIETRFVGEVTPTRFTFTSPELVYPLRAVRHSSWGRPIEVVFYVQAPQKMNLPREYSYQSSFVPMWSVATQYAVPEKLTAAETAWQRHVLPLRKAGVLHVRAERKRGREAATLEWAKRITADDLAVLAGRRPYVRDPTAPAKAEDVAGLRVLAGHVEEGRWLTKIRKEFTPDELGHDLEFVRAKVRGKGDDIEYYAKLSTSPP